MRRLIRRPATRWQWAAFALALCLIAAAAVTVWWLGRYTVAVSRLRRGVGDTVFCYAAEVEPLLRSLAGHPELAYLHRPASLEDVFLKLTGRDLRD